MTVTFKIPISEPALEVRPFFMALHHLPPFHKESQQRAETLPATDYLSTSDMSLPSLPTLPGSDIDRLCALIQGLGR